MLMFAKKASADVEAKRENQKPIPVRLCHVCGASIAYCNYAVYYNPLTLPTILPLCY